MYSPPIILEILEEPVLPLFNCKENEGCVEDRNYLFQSNLKLDSFQGESSYDRMNISEINSVDENNQPSPNNLAWNNITEEILLVETEVKYIQLREELVVSPKINQVWVKESPNQSNSILIEQIHDDSKVI